MLFFSKLSIVREDSWSETYVIEWRVKYFFDPPPLLFCPANFVKLSNHFFVLVRGPLPWKNLPITYDQKRIVLFLTCLFSYVVSFYQELPLIMGCTFFVCVFNRLSKFHNYIDNISIIIKLIKAKWCLTNKLFV